MCYLRERLAARDSGLLMSFRTIGGIMKSTLGFLALYVMTAAAGADDKKADARDAIEGYLAAALAGKAESAAALAVEGQSPSKKERIDEFKALVAVDTLKVVRVQASSKKGQAVAISEQVKLTKANPDGRDTGVLSFKLVRVNGKWLLKDIDFDTEAKAREKIDVFKKKNPDAEEVPAR